MAKPNTDETTTTKTVLILFFILVLLILLLVYLYKQLNRDTNGQYTVHRMVYQEGGVRDRLRRAVRVLEAWVNVRLWPHGEDEDFEVEEEIADLVKQDKDVESIHKRAGSEGGNEIKERDEKSEPSGDCYSIESCELIATQEESELQERETVEKLEVQGDNEKDEEEEKGTEGDKRSGGAGLQTHLKTFSGSAIWSEEKGEDIDVTAF